MIKKKNNKNFIFYKKHQMAHVRYIRITLSCLTINANTTTTTNAVVPTRAQFKEQSNAEPQTRQALLTAKSFSHTRLQKMLLSE